MNDIIQWPHVVMHILKSGVNLGSFPSDAERTLAYIKLLEKQVKQLTADSKGYTDQITNLGARAQYLEELLIKNKTGKNRTKQRLDAMEKSLDAMEKSLDAMEKSLDAMAEDAENRLRALEEKAL